MMQSPFTTWATHSLGRWRVRVLLGPEWPAGVFPIEQVHGNEIVYAGEGREVIPEADGVWTALGDRQAIGVRTADCVPLVLVSETNAVALHVSRKTVIHGLLDQLPELLPVDAITNVFIGPHICAEHFSFSYRGEEVERFCELFPGAAHMSEAGTHLSPLAVVRQYLEQWGVDTGLIQVDASCTYERAELVSYRKEWENDALPVAGHIFTIVEPV